MKNEKWKLLIKILIAMITAAGTALGLNSCI